MSGHQPPLFGPPERADGRPEWWACDTCHEPLPEPFTGAREGWTKDTQPGRNPRYRCPRCAAIVPIAGKQATSRAAAAMMDRDRLSDRAAALVAYLREHGPATDDAMQVALGLPSNSQTALRNTLMGRGIVVNTGTKGVTRSGRPAIKWGLADPIA